MNRTRRQSGLGPRLFAAQAMIVLTGSVTLLVVAVIIGPGVFHTHLRRALGTVPSGTSRHIDMAFENAIAVSLGAAVLASLVTTLAVSWFLTQRITRPVQQMAAAAERVADGEYDTAVPHARLGSEFARLDAAFNKMAGELARTETRRRELLADLAHELRTPVATLDGFLEGLQDGVLQADAETWQTMRDQTSRLRRLVQDVGTVSRAEERRVHLGAAPVDLVALAEDALRSWQPAYRDQSVDLALQDDGVPAHVIGDPDRLREVVDNLLANALHHTAAGDRVDVAVTATRDTVRLEVTDNGEGIAPATLRHLFERFYRADPARGHDTSGSGLGLTIARALVRAHGGSIGATSAGPGQGARFTVILPRTATGSSLP